MTTFADQVAFVLSDHSELTQTELPADMIAAIDADLTAIIRRIDLYERSISQPDEGLVVITPIAEAAAPVGETEGATESVTEVQPAETEAAPVAKAPEPETF